MSENKLTNIVIDTNVLISALKSKRGASFKLLSLIGEEKFNIHISVPLIIEYEDVALRNNLSNKKSITSLIDYICLIGYEHKIFYLWRPYLQDPKDDFVLELAVNADVNYIVTYNIKDFKNIGTFGISAINPKEFLQIIGEIQ